MASLKLSSSITTTSFSKNSPPNKFRATTVSFPQTLPLQPLRMLAARRIEAVKKVVTEEKKLVSKKKGAEKEVSKKREKAVSTSPGPFDPDPTLLAFLGLALLVALIAIRGGAIPGDGPGLPNHGPKPPTELPPRKREPDLKPKPKTTQVQNLERLELIHSVLVEILEISKLTTASTSTAATATAATAATEKSFAEVFTKMMLANKSPAPPARKPSWFDIFRYDANIGGFSSYGHANLPPLGVILFMATGLLIYYRGVAAKVGGAKAS